jgi:N-acetylmuramic acid 6-phosphate etherase
VSLEDHLLTESRNPRSEAIDALSPSEIVRLMNSEDARVVEAVAAESDAIAKAIEWAADRFRRGGRLIYVGAGTSGRLGVLDAAECPPTFSTPPEMVVGLIAGGPTALTRAVEGAEDDHDRGAADIDALGVGPDDLVVGIATSGRTPYVLGAVRAARRRGAATVGIACNRPSLLGDEVDIDIAPLVGPEVIAGSTRLKAGTATKMILNMISTGAMVRIGKTLGNRMVDLAPTNEKLRIRSRRMLRELAGIDDAQAREILARCEGRLKPALVVAMAGVDPDAARSLLDAHGGQVRAAVEAAIGHSSPSSRKGSPD